MSEDDLADRVAIPGSPDHRDRAGVHQPDDRRGLRVVFAGTHDVHRGLRRRDLERHPDRTAVPRSRHGVPGVQEDSDHLAVLAEHVGVETADPAFGSRGRQMFQQDRSQAASLMRVLHEKGDLSSRRRTRARRGRPVRVQLVMLGIRRRRRCALPVGDGHDLVADEGHQRSPHPLVDNGHPPNVGVGERPARAEVAEVDGARRQPAPESTQPITVTGNDPTQPGGTPVSEDDVRIPPRRVTHLSTRGSRPCNGRISRRVAATARSSGSSGSPSPASQG